MISLLPLGTVVAINGVEGRFMIYGRAQKEIATGKIFDYTACSYPEGVIDYEKVLLFNQSDIKGIFYVGFQDAEELYYRHALYEAQQKE